MEGNLGHYVLAVKDNRSLAWLCRFSFEFMNNGNAPVWVKRCDRNSGVMTKDGDKFVRHEGAPLVLFVGVLGEPEQGGHLGLGQPFCLTDGLYTGSEGPFKSGARLRLSHA